MSEQLTIQGTESIEIYHPNVILISKQELSLIEKRIFFLIYEQLKPYQGQTDFDKTIEIEIHNARTKVGQINWGEWKKTFSNLTKRSYNMIDDRNKHLDGLPFFSRVQYEGNTGTLKIKLNIEMNKAWVNLTEGYTKQMLDFCLKLSSSHAVSLYNLVCRYDKGKIVTVDWLKEFLDIKGKYPNWYDFKLKVLEIAKKEIDEKTDYILMWTIQQRRKRKVEAIKIWGEPKVDLDDPDIQEAITKKMDDFEIFEKGHRTYILNHTDEFLEAMKKCHAQEKKREIKNKGAYLLKVMGLIE